MSTAPPLNRIVGNSKLILIARVAAITLNLVTVPIILTSTGIEGFAVWEALLGLGILLASIQYITKSTLAWILGFHTKAGTSERTRWTRAAATLACVTSATALMVGCTFRREIQTSLLPQLSGIPHPQWLIPAALIPFALQTWNDISTSLLIADHRSGMVACFQTLAMTLQALTAIALLSCGFGIWSLPIAQILAGLTHVLLIRELARRTDLALSLIPGPIDLDQARAFANYSKHLLIGTICSNLRGSLDRLFLASSGNPTFLAAYGVAARIATIVNELTNLLYVPATAAAAELARNRDPDSLARLHEGLTAHLTWLLVPALGLLFPVADIAIFLWTGRYIDQAHTILAMLMVSTSFASIVTGPATAILKGEGRPQAEASYLLVTLLLNLAFLYPFLKLMPSLGTIASSSLAWVIGSCFFLLHSNPRMSRSGNNGLRLISLSLTALGAPYLIHVGFVSLTHGTSFTRSEIGLTLEIGASLLCSCLLTRCITPPPAALELGARIKSLLRNVLTTNRTQTTGSNLP